MDQRIIVPTALIATPQSSQFYAIGHANDTLTIQFPKRDKGEIVGAGSTYQYANFTAQDYAEFEAAPSLGAHFGAHIKPENEKYPCVKLTPEQVAEFITAPVEVQQAEQQAA